MQFKLSLPLLAATAWLASAQNGPFTMRWWADRNCRTRSLGCNRYESFECCPAPPSPSSFPGVRATSSGPAGIVVHTEVTSSGGCGLCVDTGALNNCYLNAPFHTMFVAQLSQCQPHMRSPFQHPNARIPVLEQHAECNRTVPINTATINGHEYDVSGPESERMEIMADLVDLPDEKFAAKWARKYRGLASDGTPTTLSTTLATVLSPTSTIDA
ncbi:hypothetical protein SMAC4_14112 [Sordaria macrospora]|uniref:uncharacterized protein n=1 Tax=Sordaria macrospora TaxID=5147 RepID=UPI002B2CE69A|nr:hypothetical protein SMAC4_14112 [Sordaria macrospora]